MSEQDQEQKQEASESKSEHKAEPKEDLSNLSDEQIKWRAKYKDAKSELETAKIQADKERAELANKAESTEKARKMYEDKYIDSELKAQAVAAGIKDIDFVKLIDKEGVKLDENGNVTGIDKAISDVKSRKPQWFGEEKKTSTSTGAKFPDKTGEQKKVDARTMSKEDYQKNRATFMAGHFG